MGTRMYTRLKFTLWQIYYVHVCQFNKLNFEQLTHFPILRVLHHSVVGQFSKVEFRQIGIVRLDKNDLIILTM